MKTKTYTSRQCRHFGSLYFRMKLAFASIYFIVRQCRIPLTRRRKWTAIINVRFSFMLVILVIIYLMST